MMSIHFLHPGRILSALDVIDQTGDSYSLSRPESLRRAFYTLAGVCVALLFIHYGRYASNVSVFIGDDAWQSLRNSGWDQMLGYIWWTVCHFLGYVLLPWLIIRFVFKQRMQDFGWRFHQTAEHWRGYLLLLSPILVFVLLASFGDDFVNHYPFYQYAGRSWFDLLLWEMLYLSQFVFLEFFFRGFMLHALRPAIGANAVWVMCVPYLMIHFPKLWLEATGAILFGLFLGILALQSRSIWGGVLVHAGVALSMDIAALARKLEIPSQWWPY